MRADIKRFIVDVCKEYGLEAYYLPDDDVYCVTKKGRAVTTFNTFKFYTIPKRARRNMILPLLKVGLAHNLGESYRDQVYHDRKLGIKII